MDKIKKIINSPMFMAILAGSVGILLMIKGDILYAGIAIGVGLTKFIGAFKDL
jgi:hypothetical protein|tara:strand:+ start:702 stop:860 length:159 start_codon:yes stop_codon:yes gene_type:complete